MEDQTGLVHHIEAPDSKQWEPSTRSTANGERVTSALEIAGDDIAFARSGVLVHAVPMHRGPAISVPGDTFWKGATGAIPPPEAPPADILLHCKDGDDRQTLRISWDMSWSDVLDLLKETFHRACVFEYDPFPQPEPEQAAASVQMPSSVSVSTLEATQRQILRQSPTAATRFWWHLHGS